MRRVLRFLWPKGWRQWITRGFVGFIVVNVAMVEMTSQSWFCNSCHIMNPYYVSWQNSSHKGVQCVSCHIAPGFNNFLTAKLNGAGQVVDDLLHRISTKPSASVEDASCTRSGCHDMAKVQAAAKNRGRYLFDHAKHLGQEHSGIEIHCTTCHSHVKGSNHFEVNTNACITCHLSKPSRASTIQLASMNMSGEGPSTRPVHMPVAGKEAPGQCKSCHEPPQKMIEYRGLKVLHAEYVAYGAACESCHTGVTDTPQKIKDDQCFSCHEFGIERLGSVKETHRIHSSGRHKVECFSCHGVTRHGPSAQSMQLDQIDCQSCHSGQHAVQQTTYKSLKASPHLPSTGDALSPMFLVHVNCNGCHTEPRPLSSKPQSGATVTAGNAAACDTCHKPGLGEQMIPLWQKNTRTLYEAAVKMIPADVQGLSPEDQRRVAEARSLLDLVKLDGSWGVHNPRYTEKLLQEAQQKLGQVQKSGGPKASR